MIKFYTSERCVLHIVIVVIVLNIKSEATSENYSIWEIEHDYTETHQSLCSKGRSLVQGHPILLKIRQSFNTTQWGRHKTKTWVERALRFISSLLIRGNSDADDESLQFDKRKREDSYELTDPAEYPYAIIILFNLRGINYSFCSATLVTLEWALTAAHCLYEDRTYIINAAWVYAGGNSFTEGTSALLNNSRLPSTAQLIEVIQRIPHPNFPQDMFKFDVGLVKTNKKFKLTNTVKPIRFGITPWKHIGYRPCVFTGFGYVRDWAGSEDDGKRKTHRLEVKYPCLCDWVLGLMGKHNDKDNFLCAKPRKDYGICSGDSGSGLVCDDGTEMTLQGVAQLTLQFDDISYCEISMLQRWLGYVDWGECGDRNLMSAFQKTFFQLIWVNSFTKQLSDEEIAGIEGNMSLMANAASWMHKYFWTRIVIAPILLNLL